MCGKYYDKVINVAKNILQIELKRYNNSPVCELKNGNGDAPRSEGPWASMHL